jgi:hypothetical protein
MGEADPVAAVAGAIAGDEERLTPNALADLCEKTIAELLPIRNATKDKAEKKRLSSRISSCRTLLLFARTRAAYVPKAKRL